MTSVFTNRKGLILPTPGDILLNCKQKKVNQKFLKVTMLFKIIRRKSNRNTSKHGIYSYLINLLLFQKKTEVIRILPITKNSLMTYHISL